jgi:hypothetical protein
LFDAYDTPVLQISDETPQAPCARWERAVRAAVASV